MANEILSAPKEENENSNRGQIHVAIGNGLFAYFDQTDDWDEHPKEPKPAREKIRKSPAEVPAQPGDGQEKDEGQADNYEGPVFGARIRGSEPDWAKRFD